MIELAGCADNAVAKAIIDAFKVLDNTRDPEVREAMWVPDVANSATVDTAATTLAALEIAIKVIR